MARNFKNGLFYLAMAVILHTASFLGGVTGLIACSKGTLILSGDETLRNAAVTSSVTEYYWKVRYSEKDKWTDVIYCTSLPVCTMIKPVLSDGTKVRVSDNGTLITLEHSAGGNAGGHTQFLFQVELKNDVRVHIFKVSFTAICIRKRVAEKANLTKVLFDRLPAWDKVEDMDFSDASGTDTFAYCNTKRCERLTVKENGNDSSLNWTNRFHVMGGALVLTVQKEDDRREIIVKVHTRHAVHVKRIRILVDTSSGISPSISHTIHSATARPSVTTSKIVSPSNIFSPSNSVFSPASCGLTLSAVSQFSSVSVTLVPNAIRTSPSPSLLEWSAPAMPNCVSGVYEQLWTMIIIIDMVACVFVCPR